MNSKELVRKLNSIQNNQIAFIGLGNPARGDDGAGIEFIHTLKRRNVFSGAVFIEAFTTPENYLGQIAALHPEIVVFIDAVKMNRDPGAIAEIDPKDIDSKGFSTHSYSIKLLEKFLSAEGIRKFKYIGIEPKTLDFDSQLSTEVLQGINDFFM
jgi:hydrogenase 3 maturation protease